MNSILQEEKTVFSNFAFISYSRKDLHWAKWLQNKLETYRLPSQVIKEHAHLPPKIAPIFRDQTDLAGVVLMEALEKALDDSQYLIVICSPNSAASQYVNAEIAYFRSLGRSKKIIPFIVEGEPFAQNPKTECFPSELQQITPELLGFSVKELGKQTAFLQVVSTLLHLEPDEIIMRDRKRQQIRNWTMAVTCALLAAAAAGTIWYNTPHSKYYNTYTYRYEIPEGIYELPKEQRQTKSESYRITTLRGDVIRLETVNSLGTVVRPLFTDAMTEYPRMDFNYSEAGQLSEVVQYDEMGNIAARKVLSYDDSKNTITIDYRMPSSSSQAKAMSSDLSAMLIGSNETTNKSEITRQVNTYDENGRLILAMYQKSDLGYPACDSNGVYGKRFEYNDQGLVTRISNLNEDGEVYNCKYGWAEEVYTYDGMGSHIGTTYYSADGKPAATENGNFSDSVIRSENGNVLVWQAFGVDGLPCNTKDGFSKQVLTYDTQGFLTTVKRYDAQDNPTYDQDGIHEVRREYDSYGRCCFYSYWDIEGLPIYSPSLSAASIRDVLDADGKLLEEYRYDIYGNPTCHTESGVYGFRCEYDENGYPSAIYYLDENGQPTMSKYGYASFHLENDANGRVLRVEHWDENGALVRGKENYAVVEYTYDPFGNQTGSQYYDENEQPCYHAQNFSKVEYEYEDGNLIREACFDTEGNPILSGNFYHACRMDYDEKGNCIRWSYYDTEGALIALKDDYAIIEKDYDAYGNVTELRYYDADRQPRIVSGFYKRCYSYDARGNLIRSESVTSLTSFLDYSVMECEYDAQDNRISEKFYDENGNLLPGDQYAAQVIYEFDDQGRMLQELALRSDGLPRDYGKAAERIHNMVRYTYDEKGNLERKQYINRDADGTDTCFGQEVYTYDPYGNVCQLDYLDGNENPVCCNEGYARRVDTYSSAGNLICREFYDDQGRPMLYSGYAFRCEYKHDAAGNVIETKRYGTDGLLMTEATDVPAICRYEYNTLGKETQATYYNQNDDLFHTETTPACRLVKFYDNMGYYIGNAVYNRDGVLVEESAFYVYIGEVHAGSPAEASGIQVNDILFQLGDWEYCGEETVSFGHELQTAIAESTYKEKELVICRLMEDGTYQFRRLQIPSGAMGIGMDSHLENVNYLNPMKEAYQQWLKKNPA